jgi:gliding motility-associated-like protein
MKKSLLILILLLSVLSLKAQTFSGKAGIIPDNNTETFYDLQIDNGAKISDKFGLTSVQIDISHTWTSDLKIFLITPGGFRITLANGLGGSAADFKNIVFDMKALTNIKNADAPFSGNYIPQDNLGLANRNKNINGKWQLAITDITPESKGVLNSWSLTFSDTLAKSTLAAPSCVTNPPAGNTCAIATPICSLDGYCGNTSGTYTADSWPQLTALFCSGIQNNSFITFVAASTSVTFNVWVTSSTLNFGIQMLVYSGGCGSGAVTGYGCNGLIPPTTGGANGSPTPFTATGLTIGNTYYLMIDGFSTDICDYIVGVPNGSVTFFNVVPNTSTICPGNSETFTASGATSYIWSPATGLNTTTGSVVIASPTVTTTYTCTPTGAGVCSAPITRTVTVPIPPSINSTPPTLSVCTGLPFNLTLNNAAILNGLNPNNYDIAFHTSLAFAQAVFPSIATPNAYIPPSLPQIIYASISSIATGCVYTASFNLAYISCGLTASNTGPVCTGNTFSLNCTNAGAGYTYAWTGPNGYTSSVQNPINVPVPTGAGPYIYSVIASLGATSLAPATTTVTVTLTPAISVVNPLGVCFPNTVDITAAAVTAGSTNLGAMTYWTNALATVPLANPTAVSTSGTYYIKSTSGTCTDIKPVTVTINPKPVIVVANPVGVCSPSTVDITTAAVTAGSTNVGATFTYWTNATATTALANPNAVTTSGTYYIQTTTASGCSDIKPVVVTVTLTPAISVVNPLGVCFPNTVDITAAAVTAGSTNLGAMTYWTNALATVPLANPTAVSTSGTYYIKSTSGTCTDIKPVTVTINPKPVIVVANPVVVCSPSTVDITTAAVTAGSTNVGATFTYWTNATATTALSNPNAVTTSGTYYIQTTTASGCSDIKPVVVTVTQSPVLVIVNPDPVCSPSTVNITATAVTVGSTGGGVLSYWTNALATVPLANPTTVGTTGIYYIKSTSGICSDIKAVSVVVNSVLNLIITNPTQVCVPGTVDITLAAVTAGSTAGGTLSYWSDMAATIPLLNTTAIATSGTYYIKSVLGPCKKIEAVVVTINALPKPLITGINNICVDFNTNTLISGTTLNSGIQPANHTFQWFLNGSTTAIAGAVGASLNINTITPGIYSVIATNTVTTCVSDVSAPFTVIQSGPPANESYTLTNAFTENQILTVGVTGFGVYEYSLDGGAYQSSNVFDHVTIGIHSVEIRDVKGDKSCLPNATLINIETIDYPHYFTPNGDGFNDTWNIARLISQPNAKIYIFDRYGKLLKQIAPTGAGWDGTFNGEPQLSTDYWFSVEYLEQNVTKVFKANFSLKR